MKNKQKGLSLVFLVILIGAIIFGILYKDKDGVTYLQKAQTLVDKMKAETIGKAEEAKSKMETRDAKLQREMKELE